jgi:hypothetical protein
LNSWRFISSILIKNKIKKCGGRDFQIFSFSE